MIAIEKNLDLLGVCVLGIVTAVGGGVIRDIICGNVPYIFQKHIYAVASTAAAILYIGIYKVIGSDLATIICSLLVVSIRLLAAYFQWNLPRIKYANK